MTKMLETINAYLREAEQSFDLSLMKVGALMEASKRQLEINYTAAELKVMQENGTDEDLAYLLEEANNGLLESGKAAIKKILDAIIKFFSDLRDKVSSTLFSAANREKLEQIQKKIKLFPLIGKKKVVIEDVAKHEKNADKHLSDLAKLHAKAKSGQNVDVSDVDKVQKSFMEEHGKLIGVGAAITVTVAAAVGILVAFNKGGFQKLQKSEKEAKEKVSDIQDDVENGKIPPSTGTKLDGNGNHIFTWPVKSEVKEQKEYDEYLSANNELWEQYQEISAKVNACREVVASPKATDEEKQAAKSKIESLYQQSDEIQLAISKKEIALMREKPVSMIWMDNLYSCRCDHAYDGCILCNESLS